MQLGFIDRLPRLAVVQAAGASPFYEYMQAKGRTPFRAAGTSGNAGDGDQDRRSGLLAQSAVRNRDFATAWWKVSPSRKSPTPRPSSGQCGIGCEPASAATLAGIRKLTAAGVIDRDADVVAVLTGNVLKDPDYIYRYHTGQLQGPDGTPIQATFGNKPILVENDADRITELIG